MIVLRGLAAVLLGVVAAAVVNTLLLAGYGIAVDPVPVGDAGGLLGAVALVAATGVVITAPAWLMFCLLVLPVVTHRARLGRRFPDGPLAAAAVLVGAVLMVPLALLIGVPAAMIPAFALFGGVGGAAVTTAWRFLILDRVAPRASAFDGVSLG